MDGVLVLLKLEGLVAKYQPCGVALVTYRLITPGFDDRTLVGAICFLYAAHSGGGDQYALRV
jgi:hypothetical protein